MNVPFKPPKKLAKWLKTVPSIPSQFKCDGCTGVVDSWLGINLFPSCEAHDWLYHLGRLGILDSSERKLSDRVLRWYTYHCLVEGGAPKWYAWYFASRRYYAVRLIAGRKFKRVV